MLRILWGLVTKVHSLMDQYYHHLFHNESLSLHLCYPFPFLRLVKSLSLPLSLSLSNIILVAFSSHWLSAGWKINSNAFKSSCIPIKFVRAVSTKAWNRPFFKSPFFLVKTMSMCVCLFIVKDFLLFAHNKLTILL